MYRTLTNFSLFLAVVAIVAAASHAPAAEWGSLKGRFVVDGKAPQPAPLAVDDKEPYCVEAKPKNETIVVGEKGGLVNAVVYVRLGRRDKIDVHPDYESQLNEPAVLDNHGCAFVPHVTTVRVGQTLLIKNTDPPPVGHNTNINLLAFNQTVPAQSETPVKVSKDGSLPMPVVCNIHPFMKGYVLSQEHPYMTVSAEDGSFEIKNLPAGKHEFQLWHEAAGYLGNLKFKGGATNRQGRVELAIAGDKTLDLGDIKVPASALKAK